MAERESAGVGSFLEGVMEKIEQKVHATGDPSSGSDSDDGNPIPSVSVAPSRIFGRKKSVHSVLGGGKPADIFLWRNKKISAGILGGSTLIWVLFECLEYHLLTLVSHVLILTLAILFLWSNANAFFRRTPPQIPEVKIPEEFVENIAVGLIFELNRAFSVLRDVALGQDLKKFLGVILGLWVLSVAGSCCSFLTLFYIAFTALHTIPLLYEKYEHQIDSAAEKASIKMKKQYAMFDAKVFSRIKMGPLMKLKKS